MTNVHTRAGRRDGGGGIRVPGPRVRRRDGAFSYSGAAIARALERSGRRVRTLTGHPERAVPGTAIDVRPLDFDDVLGLTSSLKGATTLYNTYWVRFPHGGADFDRAVANSRTLFHAARQAGVERIVHVSITHPSISSPYGYFRGKAKVERALAEVGVPYAVLRPAILFGGDGVLLNNIAWLLRHLPVFGGRAAAATYRIRAVHIDDLAALAVAAGAERRRHGDRRGGSRAADIPRAGAAHPSGGREPERDRARPRGPGAAAGLGSRGSCCATCCSRATSIGPWPTGWPTRAAPPRARSRVSEWVTRQRRRRLGRSYANEIDRHFRRRGRR